MGTLNAFYVKASGGGTEKAIKAKYPGASTEPGCPFFVIRMRDSEFEPPMKELERLSSDLQTEVIWLTFQSAVDAFRYEHFVNGEHTRSLVFGCNHSEGEWETIQGVEQPWEASVLFGDLDRWLADEYLTQQEREHLTDVYEHRRLEPGSPDPSIDAAKAAHGVAVFYRLPGWFLGSNGSPDDSWQEKMGVIIRGPISPTTPWWKRWFSRQH